MKTLLFGLTCGVFLLVTTTVPRADETNPAEISKLLSLGEILPLSTILAKVRNVTGPKILEVEVENEDFGIAYEIYFLDAQGRRREIYVDARTGEIILQKLEN